jgi:hypothetical protein
LGAGGLGAAQPEQQPEQQRTQPPRAGQKGR